MRRRSPFLASLVLIVTALLATPTLAAKIQSKSEPGTDFAKLRTWAWKTEKGPALEEVDLPIRNATAKALAEKGLQKAKPDGPPADLILEYNVSASDELVAGFGVDADWWGNLVVVPGNDSNVSAGIILLVLDGKSGKPLWAGWTIQRGTSPQALMVMRDRLPKTVRKILDKYPAK